VTVVVDHLAVVLDALEHGPLASGMKRNVPLGPLTTYRVGGPAAGLVVLHRPDDARALADALAGHSVDVAVIGLGSNLLVSDEGFAGIAVALGPEFAGVTIDSSIVTAGAAAKLPVVARTSVAAGLTGFEWAVGVPGSIGGAVRMNAGGHGADMSDSILDADVLDLREGSVRRRPAADLELGYRASAVAACELVLAARLTLDPGDPEVGQAEMAEIVQWRREHQPGGHNAGSVFTNPPGDSAGRLIDAAGLVGFRIGTAEVSTKHANFIQADPGGRAADIRRVMAEVRRRVEETHGVVLHAETVMLGFSPEQSR
jgi:UDP-N-acetylmuramate dehydrogenase